MLITAILKARMNTVESCLYNLPLSVAHVQLEIEGDPKSKVFTIVTVINEKNAMLLYTIQVNVKCTHKHTRTKMLVFIANVSSAHYTTCLFLDTVLFEKTIQHQIIV